MHIPVLLEETMEYLLPFSNKNFIDCTLNGGGHTKEILKRISPKGKVLGIEVDPDIFENIKNEKIKRLIAINDSYSNLKEIVKKENFGKVDGVLFDIGMSSYHIDSSERGFSFLKDEPLVMSYNVEKGNKTTAYEIVNGYREEDLANVIYEYGEERYSRRIARNIIERRRIKPIRTTFELVAIIGNSVPSSYKHQKIHFATRTFQAIRIEANRELDNFIDALPQAIEVLKPGGRLVVITFHSLEDRIAKVFFKERQKNQEIEILTKKPVIATNEEAKDNPRSRSAKLRAVIKL
ncbi:MAG: 16S rRNA (cytosine(1402)-N(4))-methyltransferase RsmH [Candidatus Paceibacterota bacterium]|jgi:16S rRNA (cytosine1402-N4)-methyltransferase|nr:16S rRNA (cytosine(1402)-N(4))-methyltransferase RsmH [bacterium]